MAYLGNGQEADYPQLLEAGQIVRDQIEEGREDQIVKGLVFDTHQFGHNITSPKSQLPLNIQIIIA